MATWRDAFADRVFDDGHVLLHHLLAGLLEFQENVIVAAAGQDAGFLELHLLDELEVGGDCAYPTGDLREIKAQREALLHGFAIAIAVEEELAVGDQACTAVELIEQREQVHDLLNRVLF